MSDLFQLDNDFLDLTLRGATLREWLIVLATWAVLSLVLITIHRLLSRRAANIASRLPSRYSDFIAAVVNHTRAFFLIAVGLMLAGVVAVSTSEAFEWIGHAVFLLFLLQVVIWGNSLIALYVERYREANLTTDPAAVTTMQAVGFVGRLLLWSVVFLLALDNIGYDVTALVAGLGIGGIAVALAVQNILGDLLASLSIVLDKPFAVGDFIVIDTFSGTIQEIGLETTRIRSLTGEEIIFANSDLIKSRIRNYKRMQERRILFTIGVTYQTTPEQLRLVPLIIREVIEAQPMIRFDRAHFKSFGDFALIYEVVYYVLSPEYNLYMDIQQAINLALYERFAQEGIEFAYPTQSLFVEKLPDGVMSSLNVGARAS